MVLASPVFASFRQASWKSRLADVGLLALVSGPLAAPFLAAAPLPILPQIADIIYAMGQQVCPQPELGLALWPPHLIAVCMRCYGTVLGLVLMRWAYARTQGQGRFWLYQYGLFGFAIAFVICMAYPMELALQNFDSWAVDNWVMTAFGWIAGIGLGAYIMPMFHEPEIVPKH
ncbi:MAG: DUF2085 domain-containing protein [Cyanobacteria bacterium P01_H01_bin.119]